jgi:hypothetical protein
MLPIKCEVCALRRVPGPEREGVKGGCTELDEELPDCTLPQVLQ